MGHFPESINHGIEKQFSNTGQQSHHMLHQVHYKLQYMPYLLESGMYNFRLQNPSSTDPMIAPAQV